MKKVLVIVLTLTMVMSVFFGMSTSSSALGVVIGNEVFSKNMTFENLSVDQTMDTAGYYAYGSAASAKVVAGGANGTAKAINLAGGWLILGYQEQVNGTISAGKFYRFSGWAKGAAPYRCVLVINGTTALQVDLAKKMTSVSPTEWNQYTFDFVAPAGAPVKGGGDGAFFNFQIQSANAETFLDEFSIKEIDGMVTPPPTPTPTPTPTPSPTPAPPTPTPTPAPALADNVSINAVSDKTTTLSGKTSPAAVRMFYISGTGFADKEIVSNASGVWSLKLKKTLVPGSFVSILCNAMKSVKVAAAIAPTINLVTSKVKVITGKTYKNGVVTLKAGTVTYSVKASSTGVFKKTLTKTLKKGVKITAKTKTNGVYSPTKTIYVK